MPSDPDSAVTTINAALDRFIVRRTPTETIEDWLGWQAAYNAAVADPLPPLSDHFGATPDPAEHGIAAAAASAYERAGIALAVAGFSGLDSDNMHVRALRDAVQQSPPDSNDNRCLLNAARVTHAQLDPLRIGVLSADQMRQRLTGAEDADHGSPDYVTALINSARAMINAVSIGRRVQRPIDKIIEYTNDVVATRPDVARRLAAGLPSSIDMDHAGTRTAVGVRRYMLLTQDAQPDDARVAELTTQVGAAVERSVALSASPHLPQTLTHEM